MDEFDVVILGTGPAGLSSAIFCGRANLKTIVIGIVEKSQAALAMHIENYFGFPEGVDGPVLLQKGLQQARKFGVKTLNDEIVTASPVEQAGKKVFIIKTSKGLDFKARAMIIATGIPIKYSGILNEEKLTGRGVHYCVNCDGAMYSNKNVAIVGNGNHAAEDAIEALSYTKNITIISNAPKFEFSDVLAEEVKKWNIKTMIAKVKSFSGEKFFDKMVLDDNKELKFDGVFMACGMAGALDFAADLGLEIKDNILVVDDNNMTSMEGVFAAGNCAGRCRQIAKNVGDGCNAGVNVIKYLRSRELYFDYVHNTPETKPTASVQIQIQTQTPLIQMPVKLLERKARIGWFSFSCCEDSTIVFTELLNDHYDTWKTLVDITYARILRKKNDMSNLDIAFVEGAISNEKAAEELQKIRANSKKLIAIGACAITGMPSGQRNNFDEARQKEIQPIIRAFDYSKNVQPLNLLVKVDDIVAGCPMTEIGFINILNKNLKELGFIA